MSTQLADHARHELELIGEDPDIIDGLCKVVQAYADMGHSGGSHSVILPILVELLNQRNLYPLTTDPDEWQYHDKTLWDEKEGVWQNRRNGEAFSLDGGKTYWLLGEHEHAENKVIHTSAPMKIRAA